MKPDLEALRTFVVVADAGGLTAATGRLGRTTSALSRRVAQLEGQLGATLFDRTTKQFRLTRAGQVLLECGRRVLDDVDATIAVIRQQKEETRREIIVAAFDSMTVSLLPRAIHAFCERFPRTHIQIREMYSPGVIDTVSRQGADIGIAVKGPLPPSLSFMPLLRDPFVLACTPSSRFAKRQRVAWSELQGERLIGFSPGTINRSILDRALLSKNIKIAWTYQVQQISSALALLEQGLGTLVLPSTARYNLIGKDNIISRRLVSPHIYRDIGIVKHKIRIGDKYIEKFQKHINNAAQVVFGDISASPP